MKTSLVAIIFGVCVLMSNVAYSQAQRTVDIPMCVVQLVKDIDVPAQENGLLKEVLIKEGQAIEPDQMLARIDDQVSRRMLEQARLKHSIASRMAVDNTEIKAALRKQKLATEEFENYKRLFERGSKSKQEYNRTKYSMEIAILELQAAQNTKVNAATEAETEMVNVNAAKDSIIRHAIKAPVGGHVFKIYREAGEWVNSGEKIMRVAPLDRLKVQGNMEGSRYDPHEIAGRPVTVTLTMARDRKVEFKGKVVQTGLEKRGSNIYMVVAEVENRFENNHWMLLPNSQVDMRIHLDGKIEPPSSANNMNRLQVPNNPNR